MSGQRVHQLMLEIAEIEDKGYSVEEIFTAAAAVTIGAAKQLGLTWEQLGERLALLKSLEKTDEPAGGPR